MVLPLRAVSEPAHLTVLHIPRKTIPYTELKAASYFSFLRGASSPQQMIEEAVKLGLKGLALTDLGGVYGAPRAYHALRELRKRAKEEKRIDPSLQEFKLIIGGELLLSEPPPSEIPHSAKNALPSIVMIAPTRTAYGAMCRLFTESHRHQAKGTGCLSWAEFQTWMQSIPHAEELILFPQWEEYWLNFKAKPESLHLLFTQFQSLALFKNPIYFPLSRPKDGFDQERTLYAKAVSEAFSWKCVAHQAALYHHETHQIMHDVLTSIQETIPLKELGLKLKRNAERKLKSPEEMNTLFLDFPEALACTQEVNDRCTFEMSELRYTYPSEWIPAGHSAQTYLEALCEAGMKDRYGEDSAPSLKAKISAQLKHELDLIRELNFADYFLTVYDIVEFANSKRILCQGRGSAATSVVCYVLKITAIDPIQMDFLFERFISVERGEPPDIDVDFEHERREEVIQYIYQKYGRNRAAMVSAVVTFRERSALREVAKAFSVPVGTRSAREVQKYLVNTTEVSDAIKAKVTEVVERLEDYPRHLSIHSGGFTLSSESIDTIVPIEPATMEGRTIVQWDKFDLDILGLLKIDVLALGMLSLLRKALDHTGLELYKIPHDDPKTYAMIQRADTIGVFQIESRAQMAMLPRLKPKKFYDLVVEIALVRPGPIVGKMVHPYLRRRLGLEPVVLPDPRLEPILRKTYGVPIFQEQVMKIAITLAGFTPGDADRLRRAIGAWRSAGSIDEMGMKLKKGLEENGLPESFSQQIFDQIQGFSEYGFPESHSASFSLLAYASSYLKMHHPGAFLCAILNSQPMGFYSAHTLVDDAKRHGVSVLPICVVHSHWECELINPVTVRLGFQFIRSLNETACPALIKAREEAPFKNFQDFVVRTQLSAKNLRALALAGAFEALGLSSRDALFEVLSLQEELFVQEEVQQSLFTQVTLPKLTLHEKVIQDYASTGLSVRAHPVEFLRAYVKQHPVYRHQSKWAALHSGQVRSSCTNGQSIRFLGLSVVLQRPPTAKGTAFATLEDEHGVLDLIFHRDVFTQYKEMIREEAFLWVSGEVQRDGDALQVIVRKVEKIFKEESEIDHFVLPIAPGAHAKRY